MKFFKLLLCLAFLVGLPAVGFAQEGEAVAEQVDSGTAAWMMVCTALVLLMMPGLAMFYGGLVRNKNVLGTMMHSYGAMAVVGVVWVVAGYALAFGDDFGWAGWSKDFFLLQGIDDKVEGGIPVYIHAMFQGMFAIITPAILAGAFAERVSFRGYCVFIALWCLLVYAPLCHWVWHADGFLYKDNAIDFAGGTVVHISSGVGGLVMALILGKRSGFPSQTMNPNNLVMTMVGAGFLWVGWFGFNAGSALAADLSAGQALTATQCAAAGALAWVIIEGVHYGKATSLGLVSGILAGLVVITPAAGVATPGGALILGALASGACYIGLQVKSKLGYDDSLDAFGIHGVAGMTGAILLVFFMRAGSTDLTVGKQLLVQVKSVVISIVYAGVVTGIIGIVVQKTIGLRLNQENEVNGMDQALHGEHGYDTNISTL